MHEKVAAYLEERRKKAAEQEAADREKRLIKLGLWEAEYAPEDQADSPAYPEKDEEGRRYQKVPIPVSEEEWAEIVRLDRDGVIPSAQRKNRVAWVLWIAAMVLFIGGGIVGLLLAMSYGVIQAAVSIWLPGAMYGFVLLALSEIIRLMDKG